MAERREAVDAVRRRVPVEALRERAGDRTHHSLAAALADGCGTRIVAEVKKASPSAGLLRADYRPAETAEAYAAAGAAGISVLTEPRHFLGSLQDLEAVRRRVDIPVLRKDFMCDPYQVVEAAAWGADVVLLILAALSDDEAQRLAETAAACDLEMLIETHTPEEVERALRFEAAIIGVNSRNLKTLRTDLGVARELAAAIPGDRSTMAESGIRTREDILMLEEAGYRGFLVGEVLMKSGEPGARLRELRGDAIRSE